MDENPGLSDQYRAASPWPLFVALGIPISELGILFDVFALSVGGLLLFCGSVAGMAREAEYASSAWRALAVLGVICLALGGALAVGVDLPTRGYAVVAAGVLLLVGAVTGELFVDETASPI
jgi:hypothetical protein